MAGRRLLSSPLLVPAAPPLLRPAITARGTYVSTVNNGSPFSTTSLNSASGNFVLLCGLKNNSTTTTMPGLTWNGVTIPRLGGKLNSTAGASGVMIHAMSGAAIGAQTLEITPSGGSSLGRIAIAMYDVSDWDFATYSLIGPTDYATSSLNTGINTGALAAMTKLLMIVSAPQSQHGPYSVVNGVELDDWRQSTGTAGIAACTAEYDTTEAETGPVVTFTGSVASVDRIAMAVALRNAA